MNSNDDAITKNDHASGQNITIEVYNKYLDTFIKKVSGITDKNGAIYVNEFPISYYTIHAIHPQNKYYSYISKDFILDVRGNYHDLYNFLSDNSKNVFNSYANYNYDPLVDSEFKDGIPINRDITINKGLIDGQNQARIFKIDSNKVTFNSMIFTNANNSDKGGAIYSTADLIINDCGFIDNWAPQGANIYTTKECSIEKSVIVNKYYNTTSSSDELFLTDGNNFKFNHNWWGSNNPNSLDNNPIYAKLHFSKVSTQVSMGATDYFYTLTCDLIDDEGIKYNVSWINLTGEFISYTKVVNSAKSNNHDLNWMGTLPIDVVNAKLFDYNLDLSYPFIVLQYYLNSIPRNVYLSHNYTYDENIDDSPITIKGECYLYGNQYTLDGNHKSAIMKGRNYDRIYNLNFINSKGIAYQSYASGDQTLFENCNFYNNTGNAVLDITMNNMRISGCKFINNTCSVGVVYIGYQTQVKYIPHIYNCYFENYNSKLAIKGKNSINVYNNIFVNSTNLNNAIEKVNAYNNWWFSNTPVYSFGTILKAYLQLSAVTTVGDQKISMFKVIFRDQDNNIVNVAWERPIVSNVNYQGLLDDATTKESLWVENTTGSGTINVRVDNQNLTYTFNEIDNSLTALYAFIQYHVLNNITNMTLEHDFWYYPEKDLTTGVLIKNTVNIDGAYHTVNGNGSAKLFKSSFANSTFKNLNIINGSSSDAGAGLYVVGDNTTIINCNFTNNKVTGANQDGGAVYLVGSNINVNNCIFSNNSCTQHGGAIAVRDDTGMKTNFTLINSKFYGNKANKFGGAITIYNMMTNSRIENSTFDSNSAVTQAGALWLTSGQVINCNFTNNKLTSGNGGAIHLDSIGNSKVSISNSNFENNSASGNGGAIYWVSQNGELYNSSFTANSANYAGAVYINGANAIIDRCNFTKNIATGTSAGAIMLNQKSSVNNCIFIDNNCKSEGGALKCDAAGSSLSSSIFIRNSAGSNGGAIHAWQSLNIRYCVFINNSAVTGGGLSSNNNNQQIYYSNFTGNHADKGGAYYFNGGTVSIQGSSFLNNSAIDGAGIYRVSGTLTIVDDVKIFNNIASGNGGGIYNPSTTIKNTRIYNNSAVNGGGLYVNEFANVENCYIFNNTVSGNGGGLYIAKGAAIQHNTHVFNNSAVNGGGIYLNGGTLYVQYNAQIYNNFAVNGGGIYVNNGAVSMRSQYPSADLFNNTATINGGGIYISENGKFVEATMGNIYKNTATNGGGLYVLGQLTITNVKLYNNTALGDGGALYLANSAAKSISGTSTILEYNSAGRGSAIFIADSTSSVNLNNIKLLNNFANIANITLTTVQDKRKLLVNASVDTGDNLMNAIYVDIHKDLYKNTITLSNVQYYGEGGVKTTQNNYKNIFNTIDTDACPTVHGAANENITIRLYDGEKLLKEYVNLTSDHYGMVTGLEFDKLMVADKNYTFVKLHERSNYYNYYKMNETVSIVKIDSEFKITSPVIGYGENTTVLIAFPDEAHGKLYVNITGNMNYEFVIDDIHNILNYTVNFIPTPGSYFVNATYFGDENYTVSFANCTLIVERPKTELFINVNDEFVGNDVIINFSVYSFVEGTLFDEASGQVRAYIGSKIYTVNVVNGTGKLSVSNLTINEYLVIAMYSGDDKYAGSDNYTNFHVNGYETDLNIELSTSETVVGNNITVTVHVNETINDNPMYLYVDGKLMNIVLTKNGLAQFVIDNLDYGVHNISAYSFTTDSFGSATNETHVSILKNPSKFNAEAVANSNLDVNIIVNLPEDATGYIEIVGVDLNKTVKVTGGSQSIYLGKYDAGIHSFNVTYSGDGKYYNASEITAVEVGKISDYIIDITSDALVRNLNTTFTLNIPEEFMNNGTVTFIINGLEYPNIPVINASASKTILINNDWDEVNVTAVYSGFNNYASKTVSKEFIIQPTELYEIVINVGDAYVGDNINITIEVPSKITKLNLTINGKTEEITRENFTYYINNIDEGNYTVFVSYDGDKDYAAKNNTASFKVVKQNTTLTVTADNAIYGENTTINITLPVGISGFVLITVDNVSYDYMNLTNNIIQIITNEFEYGKHNVSVTYLGDRKFNPVSDSAIFEIFKSKADIKVYDDAKVIGNNSIVDKFLDSTIVVNVELPNDATGNLTFKLYDNEGVLIKNWTTVLPKNIITYDLNELSNYSMKIIYSGDKNYETSEFNFNVSVHKFFTDAEVTFIDNNYNVASDSILNITSNLEDRNITVYVDGAYYTLALVNDGKSTINLSKLSYGNHTITLMYGGDEKYTSLFASHNIEVSKLNSNVNVSAGSVRTGNDVVVDVNASGNGVVNIIIFNDTGVVVAYNITVNNGVAYLNVPYPFVAGVYTLYASYIGDDFYYGSENSTSFTVVDRVESDVNISCPELVVNVPNTINVSTNFPIGSVDVYLDGVKQNSIDVADYKSVISLAGLSAGSHVILLSYSGDYDYTDVTKSFNIFVKKLDSSVNVSAGSVRTGNDVVVDVNASGNGIASIVVYNDDISLKFNVTVNAGKCSLTVPADKLINGTYLVNVSYLGDDFYYGSENSTSFTVTDRINSTLEFNIPVFVVNVPNSINVSSNFPAGIAEVYLDGIKQNNIIIADNKGVIDLAGLSAGNHSVRVSFAGDYDYTDVSESFNIFVEKLKSDMDVSIPEIVYGGSADISVRLLNNETGYVTFDVDGKKYIIQITDGMAKTAITGLNRGTNNISISYSGDDYYYPSIINSSIFVDLKISPVDIEVNDIIVGETVIVTVNVNSDATGNVSITVNNKTYTKDINDARAVFSIANLNVGNYTVYAVYNGDLYYSSSDANVTFLVKSNDTIDAGTITKGYNSGEDYSAKFTDALGNPLANATVTFSVDGVDYNLTTDENGVASLNIGLGIGNHTIVLYNPVTGAETHSSVNIAKPLIENKDIVTDYNSGYLYKVRVIDVDGNPVGAGVKFTIPINDKSYTYYTDKNGYITIKIDKRFTPSETNNKLVYKIKLSYRGYTVQNTITIMKTLKTKKIVKVKKSAKKLVLSATLKSSNGKAIKNKKITFKFNGKVYKAKTNSKGLAKITINKKVIKKLKAGKNYKVKITYLTDSVKSWVKVRK